MLKRIKLKNSSILLIGLLFIVVGICIGFYEYFTERKKDAYAQMNILLYKNEQPGNIESDEEIKDIIESENGDEDETTIEQKPSSNTQYDYIGILEIPKIKLSRGFLDINSRYNNVNYNITVINGSTFPDEVNNNLILAAHSGVCSVCFFDRLYNLAIGDEANIYYNNIEYQYKIVDIYEVEKTGTVAIHRDSSKNTLTLITCTRYSNTKQTVYILELYNKKTY